MRKNGIIDVDTRGMRDIAMERGLGPLLAELVSNAFDEKVTRVNVCLRHASVGKAHVEVMDDSPDGFRDLAEAYTLFARSYKRDDPEKRGRFNAGEKFVIAACECAKITSTTGQYVFDDNGRRHTRVRQEYGTTFEGMIRTTKPEVIEAEEFLKWIIPPAGVTYTVNGSTIRHPEPIATIDAQLATMVEADDGVMRPTRRYTKVSLYSSADKKGWIYELGIPVVQTGDAFTVNVQQKVPLTVSRDNVPPSYLAAIRSLTLNAVVEAGELETDDVTSEWVRSAMANENTTNEAVRKVLDLRFGPKRVSYDPSDPEANSRAFREGYAVISGRTLSKPEWEIARRANAIKPAGQVTPSVRPNFSDDPDAPREREILPENFTPNMARIVEHTRQLGTELLGTPIRVRVVNEPIALNHTSAYFGGSTLTYNLGRLGKAWFEDRWNRPAVHEIIIHELAHYYESNHLADRYHDALCNLGARMTELALRSPEMFQ